MEDIVDAVSSGMYTERRAISNSRGESTGVWVGIGLQGKISCTAFCGDVYTSEEVIGRGGRPSICAVGEPRYVSVDVMNASSSWQLELRLGLGHEDSGCEGMNNFGLALDLVRFGDSSISSHPDLSSIVCGRG